MSNSLTKTKRRIASVKSTKKITKAMEMVATVKLKRFRRSYDDDLLYVQKLEATISEILSRFKEGEESIFSKVNESAKGRLIIAITSDLGLCAGYNSNLFKFLEEMFDKDNDEIIPLGNKGKSHFAHTGFTVSPLADYFDLGMPTAEIAKGAKQLIEEYRKGTYREIIIVHTKYINSLSFEPTAFMLFPISLEYEKSPDEEHCPSLIEPVPAEFVESLIPQYITAELYAKLMESQLCEQGSRRNAMESANDNADELLAQLTIEYNKARQSAITQEIVEVVSGASSQTK